MPQREKDLIFILKDYLIQLEKRLKLLEVFTEV